MSPLSQNAFYCFNHLMAAKDDDLSFGSSPSKLMRKACRLHLLWEVWLADHIVREQPEDAMLYKPSFCGGIHVERKMQLALWKMYWQAAWTLPQANYSTRPSRQPSVIFWLQWGSVYAFSVTGNIWCNVPKNLRRIDNNLTHFASFRSVCSSDARRDSAIADLRHRSIITAVCWICVAKRGLILSKDPFAQCTRNLHLCAASFTASIIMAMVQRQIMLVEPWSSLAL